jgi:hypothetical protein
MRLMLTRAPLWGLMSLPGACNPASEPIPVTPVAHATLIAQTIVVTAPIPLEMLSGAARAAVAPGVASLSAGNSCAEQAAARCGWPGKLPG